jgi:hypothetical protein
MQLLVSPYIVQHRQIMRPIYLPFVNPQEAPLEQAGAAENRQLA